MRAPVAIYRLAPPARKCSITVDETAFWLACQPHDGGDGASQPAHASENTLEFR